MKIQIERGIPIPNGVGRPGRPGRPAKYPIRDMNVGDSFVVEFDPEKDSTGIYKTMKKVSKETGAKFTTRMVEPGKRRVWRIA